MSKKTCPNCGGIHHDEDEIYCGNDCEIEALRETTQHLAVENMLLKKHNADLSDTDSRSKEWLAEAKRDAGYPDNISFDVVWKDALRALKKSKGKTE